MSKIKTPSHKNVLFIADVPPGTKKKFKSICAAKGCSMRETIIAHMEMVIRLNS